MVGLEKLLIGRTLAGRYTVDELIGPGRAGLVYRARDSRTGAEVAVKVLNAPRSPEARERFRQLVAREVAAATAIRHANVATVHEMGGDAELDLDFVVTELVRGQSLAGVLAQRGKPPIALGLRLLGDAAEGLAAGHAAGLVHRDLRPASLYMVRGEAERHVRVKLTGFGVPQLVRRESLAVAAPEMRAYASPEMLANGSARLAPASDVFSLGMIGFELMTGALPLDDAARRALADGGKVEIEAPREVAAAVPPHVMDAVMQALRIDPAERFADGSSFAAALRQAPAPQMISVPKIITEPEPQAAAAPEPVAESPAEEPQPEPSAAAPVIAAAAGAVATAAIAADAAAAPIAVESAPAEPEAAAPVTETPVASAAAAPPAAPSKAPRRGAAAKTPDSDLPLYYPPQLAKTPAPAVPAAIVTPPAPKPVAPPIAATKVEDEAPAPVAAPVIAAVAAAAIPIPAIAAPPPIPAPTPVAESASVAIAPIPAAAPVAVEPAAPMRELKLIGGGERKKRAAGAFRAPPAMAAGFLLGILVLGSVAWIATRRTPSPAVGPATTLAAANQLAPGAVVPNGAAAAQPAAAGATDAAPAAADSAAKAPTAQQQAALDAAKKKQQEDERRKQDEEKARQAALVQQPQQPAAQTQAPPAAQAPAQQPAPAQPRPQQVAVAPPPAPAPAPPPAPAPREEAAAARSTSEVYDEDVVEERPRLTNAPELQRALRDRYPSQLAHNRVSGRVTATFVVGPDGRVDGSSIRILNSPNQGFNAPTQGVLRRARFRPATVKGQAVRVQVTMPITWSLEQ
ncbi:TonB family protein [Longimicrobium sp.]|uniref:TonB family protein n=1 Tax=Longimicrobium sp. TaxID=2029185 RepID=UPI002C0665FF|nr:TonB family protein [Longimicrobium sp.]HSU15381.1 TonB family protein [Longimicrobium sp.]